MMQNKFAILCMISKIFLQYRFWKCVSIKKSTDNSIKKCIKKSTDNSITKSTDNSIEKSIKKSTDNSIKKSTDNSIKKSTDNTIKKSTASTDDSVLLRTSQISLRIKLTLAKNLNLLHPGSVSSVCQQNPR